MDNTVARARRVEKMAGSGPRARGTLVRVPPFCVVYGQPTRFGELWCSSTCRTEGRARPRLPARYRPWRYLQEQEERIEQLRAEQEARRREEDARIEAALQEAHPRREYIPVPVRREVWRRDEGRCREYGSNRWLEFDHIMPISQGGANTVRNIQLLCEPCNRAKGSNV